MKEYPEPDVMFERPKYITLIRLSYGYDVFGPGIGIRGSQYPGDLREIIPAPYRFRRQDIEGHTSDLEEYAKLRDVEDGADEPDWDNISTVE